MKRKEMSAAVANIARVACTKLPLTLGLPSMMHGLGHPRDY
jgi:hypothetical protein